MILGVTLLVLYAIAFGAALYTVIKFFPYYKERFKAGLINRFMLHMIPLYLAFMFQWATLFYFRIKSVGRPIGPEGAALDTWLWMIATAFMAYVFVAMAYQARLQDYGLWYDLEKIYNKLGVRKGKKI